MTLQEKGHTRPNSWFLIHFHSKEKQNSLETWLVLGLGKGILKMRLEHLAVAQSKELIKKKNTEEFQKDRSFRASVSHLGSGVVLAPTTQSCVEG